VKDEEPSGVLSFRERQRAKGKAALKRRARKSAPSVSWGGINYSYVVSTIALLIAGVSAYYTIYYTNHAVLISVSTVAGTDEKIIFDGQIPFNIILFNAGNRAEVVQSISASRRYDNVSLGSSQSVGPFILKPGDAINTEVVIEAYKKMGEFEAVLDIIAFLPAIGRVAIIDLPVENVAVVEGGAISEALDPEILTYKVTRSPSYSGGMVDLFSLPYLIGDRRLY
jgi:hypothetical protein